MQVRLDNVIHIYDPRPEIISYAKGKLEIPNPDYAKKLRMGMWLGNTPKTIRLYEINGREIIFPYGTLYDVLRMAKDDEVLYDFDTSKPPINYGRGVELYDYQAIAVMNMIGKYVGLLQSPAGSGKTQMGLGIISILKHKALWITHTKDLLNQSYQRACKYVDESLLGTITEGKINIGEGITFATVQTLANIDLLRYRDAFDVIIVDEAHRVSANATSVTQFQKVLNNLSAKWKYGLSATIHRADGMINCTHALLGETVYSVPKEAVADKIMRVGIMPVGTGIRLSDECLSYDGTLDYTRMINWLCECKQRNQIIIDNIEIGKPTLVLSNRVEHLEELIRMMPAEEQQWCCTINGKMTTKAAKALREQYIEDMRVGRKKYLFATYNLAKEGLDIPCLERLYLTTPQKDYAVITQSIGRIARTSKDKADPIVYDFVDNDVYLIKAYKKRVSVYRKNECYFVGTEK